MGERNTKGAWQRIAVGDRFGTRTVVGFSRRESDNARMVVLRCDCGRCDDGMAEPRALFKGKCLTCRKCSAEAVVARRGPCALRHGGTRGKNWRDFEPEYVVWAGMHSRCRNAKDERYGGRGISVCARWSGENGYNYRLGIATRAPAGTATA